MREKDYKNQQRFFATLRMTIAAGEREMFRKDRGFSVIELIVVIAIIFVLAGALLPVLSKAREMAKRTRAREEIHQLEVALRMYGEDWGQYAPDEEFYGEIFSGCDTLIEALKAKVENGPYGTWEEDAGNFLDPWGNAYRYRYNSTVVGHNIGVAYNIYSAGPNGIYESPGPDGIYDNDDDITNW